MQDLVSVLGLGGYGLALLAAVYALLPKKGSLENQMIDQLQERVTPLEERVDRLEELLIWYRRRDVAWERYVAIIKTGSERGEMPPWPEPVGILAEVRHD
jgi:hypothetical protein